jgi:hypothetical protein
VVQLRDPGVRAWRAYLATSARRSKVPVLRLSCFEVPRTGDAIEMTDKLRTQ